MLNFQCPLYSLKSYFTANVSIYACCYFLLIVFVTILCIIAATEDVGLYIQTTTAVCCRSIESHSFVTGANQVFDHCQACVWCRLRSTAAGLNAAWSPNFVHQSIGRYFLRTVISCCVFLCLPSHRMRALCTEDRCLFVRPSVCPVSDPTCKSRVEGRSKLKITGKPMTRVTRDPIYRPKGQRSRSPCRLTP